MQIIPLSEGSFTIDKTKRFIPFDLDNDDLQQRPTGSLLVEVQPFAVLTTEDILVLDTGLGFKQDGELQIHRNLRNAGIDPARVTKVLMSHLHKDHAGGIGGDCGDGAASRSLAFPHARYYVQRKELEYAFEKGPSSYITEELECLRSSEQVEFLDGDGVIDGYIKYSITGAHCPWHQAFWIVDGGETVFFGGDVAPTLQQMKSRFVAKYDYDGKLAMELRQQWWKQGQEEGWRFLFYHDVKMPVWPAS
ncbi:MAG TPA: MBL fold metallo-hydrolase [Puia sp.]|jgi:glyoxylase-like metal-dependent hydrolase (beta-lactamase superfamily II)|nr:MBL fold metallo-hydrolase [Puia sp.]